MKTLKAYISWFLYGCLQWFGQAVLFMTLLLAVATIGVVIFDLIGIGWRPEFYDDPWNTRREHLENFMLNSLPALLILGFPLCVSVITEMIYLSKQARAKTALIWQLLEKISPEVSPLKTYTPYPLYIVWPYLARVYRVAVGLSLIAALYATIRSLLSGRAMEQMLPHAASSFLAGIVLASLFVLISLILDVGSVMTQHAASQVEMFNTLMRPKSDTTGSRLADSSRVDEETLSHLLEKTQAELRS